MAGSEDKSWWFSRSKRYRRRVLASLQKRYAEDEDFRKAAKEAARRRYHEDEEYRQRTIERAKARYRARQADLDSSR